MGNHVSGRQLLRAELARRTGCNHETIRYYEHIGLLPDLRRTERGYRLYDDTQVSRLRFILRGRELGFTVAEIRGLLELIDGGGGTCADFKDRAERHLVDVRAKISDLKRIERVLSAAVRQCTGRKVPECPILDALSS
jgi:MerR family mercuric resistance operon transcriptional regulator